MLGALSFASLAACAPVWHTFTQKVDHFDAKNLLKFEQRYVQIDDYYKAEADDTIVFYTGNEAPVSMYLGDSGFDSTIAKKFGARLVYGEHRYFGESLPFGDDSWSTDHVQFLSVEQALADYAALVVKLRRGVNAKHPEDVFVICVGGSYGGLLSAYFRHAHPHACDAALAASAPIFGAAEPFTFDPGFYESVTESFRAANNNSVDATRRAFSALLASTEQHRADAFNLCPGTPANLSVVVPFATTSFASLAMGNYPFEAAFVTPTPLPAWPLKLAANELAEGTANPLATLGAVVQRNWLGGNTSSVPCVNISAVFSHCADNTGCGSAASRASWSWDYLVCREIAVNSTSNNATDMFPPTSPPWTAEAYDAYCQARWGFDPSTRPHRWAEFAKKFGGKAIVKSATRIVFSNGLLDPWHGGGVLKNATSSLVAVVIPDGAHHVDLWRPRKDDPADVKRAHKEELAYLGKWRKEFFDSSRRAEASEALKVGFGVGSASLVIIVGVYTYLHRYSAKNRAGYDPIE